MCEQHQELSPVCIDKHKPQCYNFHGVIFMPRQARQKSESGIYHIMLRGINKQQIFLDDEDYGKFLWVLHAVKETSEFRLFAYCLMGNHIHLLIKCEKEPLEQIFRRIGSTFVYWYNVKYQRVGHLFQDRFKSEPINDESYLFTVIRYIHQNPIKASICNNIGDYRYSSFREYCGNAWLIDSDYILQMMPMDAFVAYNNQSNEDKCLENDDNLIKKLTDEQAMEIIRLYSGCNNPDEFQQIKPGEQGELFEKLKEEGLSLRQISRLTGAKMSVIRRYC